MKYLLKNQLDFNSKLSIKYKRGDLLEKIIAPREEKTYKKRYIRKIRKSERNKVHDSLVKEILDNKEEQE